MKESPRIFVLLLSSMSLLAPAMAFADEPATAPTPPATAPATQPIVAGSARGDLKAFSDELPAGGIKAALAAYHTTNDKEKAVAEALAKSDMVGSELEAIAREKFGKETVDSIDHAMRMRSDNDVLAAREEVDNDHATIIWADNKDALKMIKVDGKWRVDVSDLAGDAPDDLIKSENEATAALEKILKRVNDGDIANAYLLERAIKQQMFRVLGEED